MSTTPVPRMRKPVRLKVHVFRRKPGDPEAIPFLPWPVAAALAAVGAAAAGWVVVSGIVLVSWFTAPAVEMASMLGFGTRLWLLSFGAPMPIGGGQVTLMPLGLTAMSLALAMWAGRIATRQGALARPGNDTWLKRLALAGAITGVFLVAYVAVVALATVATEGSLSPRGLPDACVGAAAVSLIGAGWPASRGLGVWSFHTLPARARCVLAGTAGGLLAALAAAAVVVGVAVVTGWERIDTIETSLSADGTGLFSLAVITLAWLPNALAWGLAWALGGGFTVGLGSTVSLSGTQLGMLPAIPILGALPAPGVAPVGMVAWLAAGVVVGVAAGVVSVMGGGSGADIGIGADTGFDTDVGIGTDAGTGGGTNIGLIERTLLAAGCGVLVSAVIVGVAALSGGDLGTLRLIGMGPRVVELLTTGPAVIVLSAALAAAVSWLVGRSEET